MCVLGGSMKYPSSTPWVLRPEIPAAWIDAGVFDIQAAARDAVVFRELKGFRILCCLFLYTHVENRLSMHVLRELQRTCEGVLYQAYLSDP